MSVHVDLNLSNVTFADDANRHVQAQTGSLTTTDKVGRFVFSTTVGEKVIHINNTSTPAQPPGGTPPPPNSASTFHDIDAMVYYAGVKYHAADWIDIVVTVGRDLEPNTIAGGKPDFQHYVRVDGTIHLF